MLITFDIGNTAINIGLFEHEILKNMWVLYTNYLKTEDEYGIELHNMLSFEHIEHSEISKAVICSVVPSLTPVFEKLVSKYFHIYPHVLNPQNDYGIKINYDNALELGADRIANAVAVFHKYKTDSIVVDFGTAMTFDIILKEGIYEGGVIAPGIGISAEALFRKASKLPRIEITAPPTVIGKNTIRSMQSGLLYGWASMVDGLIRLIRAELKIIPRIISTGGWGEVITPKTKEIDEYDKYLTLEGLRIISSKFH